MSALRIVAAAHTGITVSDLDRSIALYRDVFGFPVSQPVECKGEIFDRLTGVDGAVMKVARVTAPGHTLELVQYVNPPGQDLPALRPCDTGTMHLAFQVEDIDEVLAALARAGVVAVNPAQTVVDGPRARVRAVYTRDTDGVVIELIEIVKREAPA